MALTSQLITLISELQHGVTSSPVLTQFDYDKPTLLKTYFSSEVMGWNLTQPVTDKESHHASTVFKDTRNFLFDLSPHGARIQPIAFCSLSCTDFESKYHYFASETAYGQWSIR